MEKFGLNKNKDGQFYFKRYRRGRRAIKNVDINIVVYGFMMWTLPSESEKEQETAR